MSDARLDGDSPEPLVARAGGSVLVRGPEGPRSKSRLTGLYLFLGILLAVCVALAIRGRISSTSAPSLGPGIRVVSIGGVDVKSTDLAATRANPGQPQLSSPFRFSEVAREAGIDFVHVSGMTEEKYSPTAN